jgi:TolB-like protein
LEVLYEKSFLGIIPLMILLAGCTGNPQSAASSANAAGGMTLDEALAEAAVRIDERIAAGSKIAPLNFDSPSDRFSLYVLDELTANLVDSGKLTVVNRNEIDLIRSEFDFQYSGDVSDDSMQSLGQMLGAQSIISGSLTDMGGFYRIVIRVLNVQNASVEVQYRANIVNDSVVAALLGGGRLGGQATLSGTATASGTSGSVQVQPQAPAQQPAPQPTAPQGQNVITVEGGASLVEKLQWIGENAARNTEYRIELTANETIGPQTLSYSGRTVTIRLIGAGGERTISLTGNGSLFTIESGVTLILDNNIALQGHSRNDAALVRVNRVGTLIMNAGAYISGNTFSSNNIYAMGGGVYVSGGTFTMNGGEIYDNSVSFASYGNGNGGGVYVDDGIFTMMGGEIYGNSASGGRDGGGGGVYVSGTFTMNGGEIYGNTASSDGGGVCVGSGTFTMNGGEIYGNTASRGGGVNVDSRQTIFTKTGGTIFGSTGTSNDNRARSGGNAVYVYVYASSDRSRNSTAGPNVNLDSSGNGVAGGWE